MGRLSRLVDRAVNRTALPGPLPASRAAFDMVRSSPVVDLVAGSALFRDSFVVGGGRGHVDLPRLRSVGVNVVGLTVATAWPDLRGTLSRWHFRSQGMPAVAVGSNLAVAEWLVGRVEGWCRASDGQLVVLRTASDVDACLLPDGPVGILLGVQGGHVLDGNLANLARLQQAGVRIFAPAHVMDNALVGSGTGRRAGGLTDHGREAIAELEALSIIVDLAHMSIAGIEQALTLLHRPFALSHTGLTDLAGRRSRWRRYSPASRNIPAALAAEVGAAGGLLGITLATELLGGSTLDAAVRTLALAIESAGEDGVALGSDMDGALRMLTDVEGLPALAGWLMKKGLPSPTVDMVLGRNAIRLLRTALPD